MTDLEQEVQRLREEIEELRVLVLGLMADGLTVHTEVQFVPDGTLDKIN